MNSKSILISFTFILLFAFNALAIDFSNIFVGCDYPTAIVNLDGTVTDAVTAAPIYGASCVLVRSSDQFICSSVRTNNFGHYVFPPVFTQGTFFITVSAKGYIQQTKFTNALGDETINFQLTQ